LVLAGAVLLVLTGTLLLALLDLWLLVVLALVVFAVFVVVSVVAVLATAGIVNEKTTIDANNRLSSFFMFILLLLEFGVRSS
jgi:uncharacterized membrane protein